jgi:endogenous inhibitor of DNA gyrase (YacG/DUF329 family)
MDTQTREAFYEEWIKSMETVQRECTECAEELTMGVSAYVQSESSYGFPFDAVFYAAPCPICHHVNEWGQREAESGDALLLRERWGPISRALGIRWIA